MILPIQAQPVSREALGPRIVDAASGIVLAGEKGDKAQKSPTVQDLKFKFRCRKKCNRLVMKQKGGGGNGIATALMCTDADNGWKDAVEL